MDTPTSSRTLIALAACMVCVPAASRHACAGDKKPPQLGAVLLRDVDVSRDIPPAEQQRKDQTLRPRAIHAYDELRSAV
jgi:hypothetical protein